MYTKKNEDIRLTTTITLTKFLRCNNLIANKLRIEYIRLLLLN